MKYLRVNLYTGKAINITEGEFRAAKRGLGKAIAGGTPGITTWQGEEELLIRTDTDESFTEDEVNDAHGWR